MPDIVFVDDVLVRIRNRGGKQYDEKAYLFLLAAIEYLQGKLDRRRHVTAAELSWACRDLALERFGLLSRTVLDCWGLTSTADFGRIVYTLVDVSLLSTQPGDREEDFHGVYDFQAAFDDSYALEWAPEA
jgi:uncharacterized repeat protein (TIGR04138 family)